MTLCPLLGNVTNEAKGHSFQHFILLGGRSVLVHDLGHCSSGPDAWQLIPHFGPIA